MGGGGGGDGGFQERADAENLRKQRGRDAINALFGVAPTMAPTGAPSRDAYTRTQTYQPNPGDSGGDPVTSSFFDQAAFDRAMADYNATRGLADRANAAKAGRDQLYAKVRNDFFSAGRRQIDEQKADAERRLKFDLFDRGLNGSSIASDQMDKVRRTYDQGLLDLGAKADAAAADLRGSDEQTRLGLLQSLDNGMDQGSATSAAANQMKVASDKAAAGAQGANIGDLFGGIGLQASRVQDRKNAMDTYERWRQGVNGNTGGPLYTRTGG